MKLRPNSAWWTKTWNPVVGCAPCSPGCENCYAARTAWRLAHIDATAPVYRGLAEYGSGGGVQWTGRVVRNSDALFTAPRRWRKPQRIFLGSMCDLLYGKIPVPLFSAVIDEMRRSPQHQYVIVTKRARYLLDMLDLVGARDNEWWCVTATNQAEANVNVTHLLRSKAKRRAVSLEPLLGAIDLTVLPDGSWHDSEGADFYNALVGDAYWSNGDYGLGGGPKIDQVFVGGETGAGARACDIDWIGGVATGCFYFGVPIWVKQLGAKPKNWCKSILLDPDPSYLAADFCDIYEASEGGHCGDRCMYLKSRATADPDEWPPYFRRRDLHEELRTCSRPI